MIVSAHHTKAEQVIPPKGIICGLHMHTVAGIVRPQGAAGIVKDRIAVDEKHVYTIGQLLQLRIAGVDGGVCVEGGVRFFLRESNPPPRLGKPMYYRCTNPASR